MVAITLPCALVERSAFAMFDIAKLVVVAFVVVLLPTMTRLPFTVEDAVERNPLSVASPEVFKVVMPVNAPLVTSHESEFTLIVSLPSPIVSEPVVVSVPEMLFDPITPPESVRASDT